MTFRVADGYSLEISIDNVKLENTEGIIEELTIHESIHQALPTMDIVMVNDGSLIESKPLSDGAQIDITLIINDKEELKFESVLWSYEAQRLSQGIQLVLHCVMSCPDFLEGRIESVNGSSFDVFQLMADRSRMKLIADPSVDKQVWIRPGIRGNIWLNNVINHSWSSPQSAFIYAVTRQRELLRYNLSERAARTAKWFFTPELELKNDEIPDNVIKYKYATFSSQSGFLNSHFGYGRKLATFDVDQGCCTNHQVETFRKRVQFMNLNSNREIPQKYDSLGFGNSMNIHENYFNAFAQNSRIKSFYSVNVDLMSEYFREVRLLDRVKLQVLDQSSPESSQTQKNSSGDYFVDKIATVVSDLSVSRRFSLTREGFNADTVANAK